MVAEQSGVLSLQILEYSGQAAITLSMILSGNWILGALHLALLLYFMNLVRTRQHLIDTTDVFKQLPIQKKRRLAVFVIYAVLFVFTAYRYVCAVLVCGPIQGAAW